MLFYALLLPGDYLKPAGLGKAVLGADQTGVYEAGELQYKVEACIVGTPGNYKVVKDGTHDDELVAVLYSLFGVVNADITVSAPPKPKPKAVVEAVVVPLGQEAASTEKTKDAQPAVTESEKTIPPKVQETKLEKATLSQKKKLSAPVVNPEKDVKDSKAEIDYAPSKETSADAENLSNMEPTLNAKETPKPNTPIHEPTKTETGGLKKTGYTTSTKILVAVGLSSVAILVGGLTAFLRNRK